MMVICRKKGFTLIELLVVIAIIALLLSIVMPALRNAQKRTQTVICRSNIRHWGLIFSLYAQDNEQSFPQSVGGGGVTPRKAYWMGATLPYYGDGKIRSCPSTKPDIVVAGMNYGSTYEEWGPLSRTSTPADWWDNFPNGSYGLNDWCCDPPSHLTEIWNPPFETVNTIRKITAEGGSRIPMFLDCAFLEGFPRETDKPPTKPDKRNTWDKNAMKLFCIDRHKGGINGVFADLSARKIGLKELWKLKWHKSYNIDNAWTQPDAEWPPWMKKYNK